jgi:FtsP/CotA-like multicopper oxidase with cupredoxin domain
MSTDVLAPPVAAPRTRYSPVGLAVVGLATAGAAGIHLAVVPEHFGDYPLFGVFFLVVGLAQLAAALGVPLAPNRRRLVAVASGMLALVGLWAVSRTVGLPIGPEAWRPEPVGVPDVVCETLQLTSVGVLGGLIWRGPRMRVRRRARTALALAPIALLVAVATFAGAGAGLSGITKEFSAAPPSADPLGTPVTALVVAPSTPLRSVPVKAFTLTARAALIGGQLAYTYNGTVPGPELRVTQGDRVRVTLVNELPVATTLHWHGVRVPNAEDGVAGLTQDAVAPGRSFVYEFVAGDAGTFWYHSHQDTGHQIPAGLFGALVVEPVGGRVAEDVEHTVLLHNGPAGVHSVAVNGTTGDLVLPAAPGQTTRLRIIDAVGASMDGTAEAPVLLGAPYRVLALDGQDLSGPGLLGPQRLALGMGQRIDVEFVMPSSGAVRLVDSRIPGTRSPLQGFFDHPERPDETVTLGSGLPPPEVDVTRLPVFDPLRYGAPSSDPIIRTPPAVTVPVVLGERPGFYDGTVELVHSINGAASPDVPPITVHRGQLVRLHLVNQTGEFHPMHLHGHVMSVLDVDGRPPAGGPIRLDTVLLWPRQTADVVFVADNPGIWMLHCHVLVHASVGMSMTVNYAGITTPFTMGARSGNVSE